MKIDETKTGRLKVDPARNRQLREQSDELAIAALGYLAADEERLERLVALTGLRPGDLRRQAAEPGFLASILDHIASDERLLLAFAADAGVKPEAVARARLYYEHGA